MSREGEFLLSFFHPPWDREVQGMNHPWVLDTFQKYAFFWVVLNQVSMFFDARSFHVPTETG